VLCGDKLDKTSPFGSRAGLDYLLRLLGVGHALDQRVEALVVILDEWES
jgi:uncharacterized protein YfeS